MKKTLIGILSETTIHQDLWNYQKIEEEIRKILIENNAIGIGLLSHDVNDSIEIMKKIDGMIYHKREFDKQLEELISFCKLQNIPTLEINKTEEKNSKLNIFLTNIQNKQN